MLPHDSADLALAPVARALDARLEHLGTLTEEEVTFEVALQVNDEPSSRDDRESGLLAAIVADVDLHGWQPSWTPRGLSISHSDRSVVLGLPRSVITYLEG